MWQWRKEQVDLIEREQGVEVILLFLEDTGSPCVLPLQVIEVACVSDLIIRRKEKKKNSLLLQRVGDCSLG